MDSSEEQHVLEHISELETFLQSNTASEFRSVDRDTAESFGARLAGDDQMTKTEGEFLVVQSVWGIGYLAVFE